MQFFLRRLVMLIALAMVARHSMSAQDSVPPRKVNVEIARRVPPPILRVHGINNEILRNFKAQVLITITAVDPTPTWAGQPFAVRYTLTNLTLETARGTTAGFLDGVSIGAPAGAVNLSPGQSMEGQLSAVAGNAPTQHLRVRYTDKVECHDVPVWTGGSRRVCLAGVDAQDAVDLTVRSVGDILTSSDVPLNQAPAGAELCGGGTDTYPHMGVPFEWADVANAADVPALGWVVTARNPGSDVPFTHPFGADYTFGIVLDHAYWPLLNQRGFESTANCSQAGIAAGLGDADICAAFPVAWSKGYGWTPLGGIPDIGIDHAEVENGLLPTFYRPIDGDRVYLRGRRIIDCGHPNFVAELHPPTLIVAARQLPNGVLSTTLGVPYRTLQTFEPRGLPFHPQLAAEIGAVTQTPVPLNLRAQIATTPFSSPVIAHYRVAVPPVAGKGAATLGYHFSTRPGVGVVVTKTSDFEADVVVTLDPATFVPPPDPSCTSHQITLSEAETLGGLAPGSLTGLFNQYVKPASYTAGLWAPLLVLVPFAGPILAAEVPRWLIDATISAELGLNTKSCTVTGGDGGGHILLRGTSGPGLLLDNQVMPNPAQAYPVTGWVWLGWNQ